MINTYITVRFNFLRIEIKFNYRHKIAAEQGGKIVLSGHLVLVEQIRQWDINEKAGGFFVSYTGLE